MLDPGSVWLQRLFDYISGENEPQVKINMTAPVVTKVEHGDGPFCKNNFTVSFFVPFSEQARVAVDLHAMYLILEQQHDRQHHQANRTRRSTFIVPD